MRRLPAVILLCVFCCWSGAVLGQSTNAAVTGVVSDPAKAVIADADVVAINQGTDIHYTAATNGSGNYYIAALPPGTYRVEVTKPGFKTILKSGIVLHIQDVVELNFEMTVGSASESVTVQAGIEGVHTVTSTVGRLIDSQDLTNIPLTNRNYTEMLHLSAGVTASLTNAAEVGLNTQDIYVHGGTTLDNSYQMDGAQLNDPQSNVSGAGVGCGGIPIPNPDAIQEFNIQTGQYDAASGRSLGANVNVVTKSGTNKLHGSLFEFFRNDVLNANDYFLIREGQPRAEMKQNQFGFTLGGPIKRDKLFFFGAYQGTRQVNGLAFASLRSMNLPPLTNDRSAAALGALFAGQRGVYQNLFGGVGPAIQADGSNINPVALALLQVKLPNGQYYVPTPQTIVNGLGMATFSEPSHFSEDQMMENIDYAVSPKHLLSAHWFSAWDAEKLGFSENTTVANTSMVPGNGPHRPTDYYTLTAKLTSTLSNFVVNEARFSYVDNSVDEAGGGAVKAAQVGMQGGDAELPDIELIGQFALGANINDGARGQSRTFQAADQIAWTRGKHNIRAGFAFERLHTTTDISSLERGLIIFPSFPDFLLGLPASQTDTPLSNLLESVGFSMKMPRIFLANDWALYLQDDYKLHPQVTLNLGLRWDVFGDIYEANGEIGNFDPRLATPMPPAGGTYTGWLAPANFPTTLPAGVTRNDNNSLGNGTPLRNFAPRIGLAWRPLANNQNFVMHAGYGIFYQRNAASENVSLALATPYAALEQLGGPANALASFQQPFNPAPPPVSALPIWPLRTPTSNLSTTVLAPNFRPPMDQQWSANLQYKFSDVVLEVGYIGSHGTRLFEMLESNIAQLASPQTPINGQTTNALENVGMRVPIVGFTPDGLRGQINSGMTLYNGLEVTVRKQLSHGLQLQGAYTFSKTLTDVLAGVGSIKAYGGIPQSTVNDGRGLAENSRPNRFVLSYLYKFPVVHGGTEAMGKVLSGWELSGVTTVQSGNPLTLMDSRAGSIYGADDTSFFYQPANFCPGSSNHSLATSGSIENRLNDYINMGAVCPPPVIGDGTGYGNIGRGALRGPDQNSWDISLGKITKITEFSNLEFRAQFFNAFNHPQFANPLVDAGAPGLGTINSTSVSPRLIQFALKYNF